MAKLDRIVRITLTNQTRTIRVNDFNRMLLVAPHTLSLSRVLGITSADELLDLGADPTGSIYRAAVTHFAQKPAADVLYIGRQRVGQAVFQPKGEAGPFKMKFTWRDGADGEKRTAEIEVNIAPPEPEPDQPYPVLRITGKEETSPGKYKISGEVTVTGGTASEVSISSEEAPNLKLKDDQTFQYTVNMKDETRDIDITPYADGVAGETVIVTVPSKDAAPGPDDDNPKPEPDERSGYMRQLGQQSVIGQIVAAINASDATSALSATEQGDSFTVSAQDPDTQWTAQAGANVVALDAGSDEDWPTSLHAIQTENDMWYGLAIVSRDESDVLAVADWAEAANKLFGTVGQGDQIDDGSVVSDIASKLKEKNLTHTFVIAAKKPELFYEIALMSRCFTVLPGGETWANKELRVVTADQLLESEYDAAFKKNANTYETFNGEFPLSQTGKVASGEWIDVVRFGDWLVAQMQADIVFTMINNDKIPYTDQGIGVICNAMIPSLNLGMSRGGIAPPEIDEDGDVSPPWIIQRPRASSISPNNKGKRVLRDLGADVRLAGAIHQVRMGIRFVYEL